MRLLDGRFAKPIQSEVVKPATDATAPELGHHVQGLQNAVAHRDHSDRLVVLERNVRLPLWIGECGDPVRANRVSRKVIAAWWEDVLEARDRRSARDPETQIGILHRRAHDSHVYVAAPARARSARTRQPLEQNTASRRIAVKVCPHAAQSTSLAGRRRRSRRASAAHSSEQNRCAPLERTNSATHCSHRPVAISTPRARATPSRCAACIRLGTHPRHVTFPRLDRHSGEPTALRHSP